MPYRVGLFVARNMEIYYLQRVNKIHLQSNVNRYRVHFFPEPASPIGGCAAGLMFGECKAQSFREGEKNKN